MGRRGPKAGKRAATPPELQIEPLKEHITSIRSKIKGAMQLRDEQNLDTSNHEIFSTFGVPDRTGYRLVSGNDRRLHNEESKETRGRHRTIPEHKINEMCAFIENEGLEARSLS